VGGYDGDDYGPIYQAPEIRVEVSGLDDFGRLLRAEFDAGFRPGKSVIELDHGRGVGFGERNPSMDMQAVRQKYLECLQRAMGNLAAYVYYSEILISAVDKIATAYRDSDALSAAGQQQVEQALATAFLEAQAAKAEEAKRELHRETARLRLSGAS